jgi:hypothetical protein
MLFPSLNDLLSLLPLAGAFEVSSGDNTLYLFGASTPSIRPSKARVT